MTTAKAWLFLLAGLLAAPTPPPPPKPHPAADAMRRAVEYKVRAFLLRREADRYELLAAVWEREARLLSEYPPRPTAGQKRY